jgi:hypothetical protein
MGMPELTSDIQGMAGSSPKNIAAIAVLRLYEKYFEYMAIHENVNVEQMTAALLICCPEKKRREEMWKTYLEQKKATGSEVSASVYSVGDWYEYMSGAMGLNETSTGGW